MSVANGNKLLYSDIVELNLTFSAKGGDCQVVAHSQLYELEGWQNDVILGMDFVK